MEELEMLTELLTTNPVTAALANAGNGFPPENIDFPPNLPGAGEGMGPSFPKTAAAFTDSAADLNTFFTNNLAGYGTAAANAVTTTATAYQMAFESLAGSLAGLAPEQPAPGGAAPGTATAAALAAGLDNAGQAVALSLGNDGNSGALFAAQTIGNALSAAGTDVAAGFATGADIITALGTAIENNAPGTGPGNANPEGPLVTGIATGFAGFVDAYNMGADALTVALPAEVAGGITDLGTAFLNGAGDLTGTIAEQIEGFMLPAGAGMPMGGDLPTSPEAFVAFVQDALMPITSQLSPEQLTLPTGNLPMIPGL